MGPLIPSLEIIKKFARRKNRRRRQDSRAGIIGAGPFISFIFILFILNYGGGFGFGNHYIKDFILTGEFLFIKIDLGAHVPFLPWAHARLGAWAWA
jgi:hypothetical protein